MSYFKIIFNLIFYTRQYLYSRKFIQEIHFQDIHSIYIYYIYVLIEKNYNYKLLYNYNKLYILDNYK